MKRFSNAGDSLKHFILVSIAVFAGLAGTPAEGTSILIYNLGRYDGVDCDKLMALYKQAYLSAGFKLDRVETLPGLFTMIFSFPNPTDRTKPAGGGSIQFSSPTANETGCVAYRVTMGVLGHYDAYNLEEHVAFENLINAADQKAQAQITKKVGPPKSLRK